MNIFSKLFLLLAVVKLTQIIHQIFQLPALKVTDAVLTDGVEPTDRVIISKAYEEHKKDSGDQTKTANLTKIADLADGQFKRAFAEIHRRVGQGKRTGIIHIKSSGPKAHTAQKTAGASDALFTYATISIREQSYDGTGRMKAWYYVVKTPVDLISGATRRACGDAIVVREIDLLAVKGKSQAVRVFELIALAGDAEPDELANIATFEKGLAAYRDQDWDTAERCFGEVLARGGDRGDGASKTYLKRVAIFRETPPPEAWDGVFSATMK